MGKNSIFTVIVVYITTPPGGVFIFIFTISSQM